MWVNVSTGAVVCPAGIGRVVFANARVEHPVQRALAGEGTVLLARTPIGAQQS